VVETLIEVRGKAIEPDRLDAAKAALGHPDDSRLIADWLADVLEGADATRLPDEIAA